MGFEYALVHLKFTIPPAIALTLLYRPFLHPIDLYKILFLVTVAFVATVPWDSYLIRHNIWTYPSRVILGPTLFSIPAEELFFFVIQTYNTTFLYLILSKPVFPSCYLPFPGKRSFSFARHGILLLFALLIALGAFWTRKGGEGTYLGLILVWAGPFALFLWALSSSFLVALPYTSTILPIALPTLYLWIVDTLALRRGTWTIASGTKLGIHLWDGLEIEEAIFFLATNTLIVFGLVAFDHAYVNLLTFPSIFPTVPRTPSPLLMMRALLMNPSKRDGERIVGIQQAASRLQRKSRSFFLASSVFHGRLRIDLTLLYSFCRVADDLVDDAATEAEAREWIHKLAHYLDLVYADTTVAIARNPHLCSYIAENFPAATHSTLTLLPAQRLSRQPLHDLLEGFRTDLEFPARAASKSSQGFPIVDERALELYSARVAGTVAEMCLELVFHHSHTVVTATARESLVRSGGRMGIALQYVNISRDIETDARMGRVYLPTSWLKEAGLSAHDVIENPAGPAIDSLRATLLNKAFGIYDEAQPALAQLPEDSRAPMGVAVESYMEIGRVLREGKYTMKKGRATVPKARRLRVAWNALSERR